MKFNKLIYILLIIFELVVISDFPAAWTLENMRMVGRDNENLEVESNISISDTKIDEMFILGGDGNTKF